MIAAIFLQMQGARASLACPRTISKQVRGAIVSAYFVYGFMLVLYRYSPLFAQVQQGMGLQLARGDITGGAQGILQIKDAATPFGECAP